MIRLIDVSIVRGGRRVLLVESLTIAAGDRLLVHGPNGCGKTSLLRVLAGLDAPAPTLSPLAPTGRRVLVHQKPRLFRGTVTRNVAYGIRHLAQAERTRRVADMLRALEIDHLADRAVRGLSGGEVRRVALARAIVAEPDMLLLDEPFADLDEDGCARLWRALAQRPGMGVVIASPTPPRIGGSGFASIPVVAGRIAVFDGATRENPPAMIPGDEQR